MFAATEQGIWRSDDGGLTWTEKTQGLPWKEIQGFAGGSDACKVLVVLYCSIRSQAENGEFRGGLYRSRDRGETWQSAMGRGLNTDNRAGGPMGVRSHLPISPAPDHGRPAAHGLRAQYEHWLPSASQRHRISE